MKRQIPLDEEKSTQRQQEYEFIRDFIQDSFFDGKHAGEQLRALWTAYCFHAVLNVDTARYDADLQELWEIISDGGKGDTADWSSFVSFDNFMAELLV